MDRAWVKPSFEEVSVNAECTAYAGAVRLDVGREEARAGGPGSAAAGRGGEAPVRMPGPAVAGG